MNQREYQTLRKDAEEKCKRAIQAAKAERDSTIAAIETVWRLSTLRKSVASQVPVSEPTTGDTIKRGELARAIDAILPQMPGRFGLGDVVTMLQTSSPAIAESVARSSISSVLGRLADNKVLVEVEAGRGRRSAVYSVAKPPPPTKPLTG
jgi:hypothetical protein